MGNPQSLQFQKTKAILNAPVDAGADIGLINQYALKELKPEDVFVFSVVLCDNEVDRDFEKFSDSALDGLASLFVGKTGIFNHSWNAKDQVARIYKAFVDAPGGKNSLGEPLKQLKAYAYILRDDSSLETIKKIEGGILKEVSVGAVMKEAVCSICGKSVYGAECSHLKGRNYDGKLSYATLQGPSDAYEFSFVAVPAQRGAGVTKSFENIEKEVRELFNVPPEADLSQFTGQFEEFLGALRMSAEEKQKRQRIIEENKKFIINQEENT